MHSSLFVLFAIASLLFSSVHAQITWSNMTSTQLSTLKPSDFSSITAAELGSIPTGACTAFTAVQIAALPVPAAPGFTSAQVAVLPGVYSSDACGGFTASFMGAMQPAAFGGFKSGCIGILKPAALASWTADQVATLQPQACSGFTGANIAQLNASAFAGFSQAQVASFTGVYSSDACAGLQPNQVMNLPGVSFAGLTRGCISILNSQAFSLIYPEQLGNLTANAAGGLTATVVKNLSPASGAGWTVTNLEGVADVYTSDGCAGFQPAHVATIQPAAFAGWTQSCVRLLPAQAWAQTNANQIAQLTATAAGGLTAVVMKDIAPAAGAGWTAQNLAGVAHVYSSDGCAGFQPAHVATMQPAAFAGWTQSCVRLLPLVAWSQTNPDQINMLSLNGASGLTASVVRLMPGTAGAGWNSANLGQVASVYSSDGCAGFSSAQVGNMTSGAFSGWTQSCVRLLFSIAFSQTNALQIANFSTSGASGMSSSLVSNMPPAAAAGWTSTNLAAVAQAYSSDGCAGFTSDQIAAMLPTAFPGWTASCVNLLNPSIFSTISSADMNTFPSNAYLGFNSAQMANIRDPVLTSIPLPLFAFFSSTGVSGFSAHQLAIVVQTYGVNFTNLMVNTQLNFYAMYNITSILQFKAMNPSPLAPLYQAFPTPNTTWLQAALTSAVAINSDVIKNFTCGTLWGITAAQAPLMAIDTLQTIATSKCGQFVLPDTINALNCTQLSALAPMQNTMISASLAAYKQKASACPGGVTTLSSTSSGQTSWNPTTASNSVSNSHSNSLSSSSSSTTHGKKPGMPVGELAGIIAGGVVGVAVISAIVFFMLRRRTATAYPPLIPK